MSDFVDVIVCVPWGQHSMPAERRICPCGVAVALSRGNVAAADRMGLVAICLACVSGRVDDDEVAALVGMVNGELFPDIVSGFRAAAAERDRN